MTEGRGGFWNRAGRRSGGNRPSEIVIPQDCPNCGADILKLQWRLNLGSGKSWQRCMACGKPTGRERGPR